MNKNTITPFDIETCVGVVRKGTIEDRYDNYSWCTTHDRRMKYCNDEHTNQKMTEHLVESFAEAMFENKYRLTVAQRKRILEAMALERCEYDFDENDRFWCFTHKEPANHCAPNGDDRCCATYARSEGCSCCDGNSV
jgi:hypothetical protein